ncbi:MAG TPA: molecular chaperone TorD family protein, partial [Kofleriaceae bacterium]|nr:molecular chaperone TorD family protein [Kofleriaceae bacterium]
MSEVKAVAPTWRALAEDARMLTALHDRELDAARWDALAQVEFPRNLTFPVEPELAEAFSYARATWPAMVADPLTALAADYAGIYLTHACRVSPCESPWIDEDGLVMQEPMFEVRAWYARFGLEVEDWRMRTDDHLAHELDFVAALLEHGELAAAAGFLDEHLLVWVPEFARAVAHRADTPFYAALAHLTTAWLAGVRPLDEDVRAYLRAVAAVPLAAAPQIS